MVPPPINTEGGGRHSHPRKGNMFFSEYPFENKVKETLNKEENNCSHHAKDQQAAIDITFLVSRYALLLDSQGPHV